MLFSSPFFIFIFLPLFFASFYLASAKYRDYVLLAASLTFYFWGEPSFCLLALASAALDYGLCQMIHRSGVGSAKARRLVALGICANLLILFYFKYSNFFLASLAKLLPGDALHFKLFNILLPIGVSFIVFEKITYLVDVYRGTGKPAKGLIKYLNYVFLFPKLLAGPIIKYHEIEKQLHQPSLSTDHIVQGFKRFLGGLAKKVFIADACGSFTNQVFALSAPELSFTYAWLGLLCFSLQIYFDFSGYSDMALGLARMMGFELRENFNLPYIATSFTDFWRRWHISLSTWIREYLYIPLGGNRASPVRIYFNLWVCFLLSGLWHGANWTFVLWGAYNGLFLVLDKLAWLKISAKLPRLLQTSLTLILVMLGWVIFRSSDFHQLQYYFSALLHPGYQTGSYLDLTADIYTAIVIGSLLALLPLAPGYMKLTEKYFYWQNRVLSEGIVFSSLGLLALCKVVGNSYTPFLYFKF